MKKSLGAETIVYPTPVFIVGSYDESGRANVMNAAWGGICCSEPPCVAISLRKSRYTYKNIKQREAFTISIPSEAHAKEADYFGLVSGKTEDKFARTGLTPVRSELVDAPYVSEFPLVLECRLVHTFELGIHIQFVGQILDVKAEESVLDDQGMPQPDRIQPLTFAPGPNEYYGLGRCVGKAFSIGEDV
jgi:flavin reductase (DIM6/NTAB) family NADH-FMN oxidoreductase RutF